MAGRRKDDPALDEETRHVAAMVRDLLASSYGPGGGLTLLVEDDLQLHDAAGALRDLPSTHPGLAPYRQLVADTARAVGDQATLAGLLAAGMVHHGHQVMQEGHPRAAVLEGLSLARRQSLAWLAAQARRAEPVDCLSGCDPHGWRHEVVPGLLRLADGLLDLDQVDLRAEAGETWQDGLRLDLHGTPKPVQGARILILEEGPGRKLRGDAVWRTSGAASEQAIDDAFLHQLDRLGIDVLLVAGRLGEFRDRVASRILVADDVTKDARTRIEQATGAEPIARLAEATLEHVGMADLEPLHHRTGGWRLHGPGPGATFAIGRHDPATQALLMDRAERLLRSAGVVLDDPRRLPGGGRWQRGLARSLRDAADHAPGKSAIGLQVAARTLDDVVAALLRNVGKDPLDGGVLEEVADAAPCVEQALAAAFELAQALLRIDARLSKRPSQGADLRGGTGPAGSPKGMPGDIPPLM